jgi:hypothetical protein
LLLVLQSAAIFCVARLTSFEHGFPLDDAWIHQVVGRTFAETGVLGYTPERFGSAATSLAWGAIVAINHRWLELEPALFTFAVNALLFVSVGQLWLAMLRRDGAPLPAAFGGAAFASTASNYVWFALSGMESMLLVFLSTLAIWLWTNPEGRSTRSAWGAGLVVGALFLTRPEAAALLGVFVVALPWLSRSWRDLVPATVPCMVAVAGYAWAMAGATGDARPSTLEGRRVMWFQDVPTAGPFELAERMLVMWGDRLAEHTLALTSSRLFFWVMLGLSLGGALVVLRRRWVRFGSLVVWGAAHIGVYMVLLPTAGHGGRYQPLTPALFSGLCWIGLWAAAEAVFARYSTPTRARSTIIVALAALMAVPTGISLVAWSKAHRDAVAHIWDTEVGMGRALSELPSTAVVASFDIGGIGYFANRDLVDLGALVDASLVDALRRSDGWSVLDARGVDYVVLPEGFGHAFPDPWSFYWRLGLHKQPEQRLIALERLSSEESVWKRGVEASLHGAPAQVLYRVESAP